MSKSSKRIRLEKEIFSKSIKDIERMFNFSYHDDGDRVHKPLSRRSAPDNFSRLDLPAGSMLQSTSFSYDCVNLSLIQSDSEDADESPVKPPVLPSSSLLPGRMPPLPADHIPRNVVFDLNDDDDVDDYRLKLDLKYTPRVNLERDLMVIEQMFTRPLPLAH